MADLAKARQSALSLSSSARALPNVPFARLLPPASRHILRGGPRVMAAAGSALGLSLSTEPCRAEQGNGRAALWLGPDEQLLLAPENEDAEIRRILEEALAGLPYSLVDIGHRQLALQLEGPNAALALNVGCPLDLDLSAFPVGMCTRTLLGKADIVLWRSGAERFHVEVWRSFADYLSKYLAEAARELAC